MAPPALSMRSLIGGDALEAIDTTDDAPHVNVIMFLHVRDRDWTSVGVCWRAFSN